MATRTTGGAPARSVRVPTTERGVDGFIKNLHDAFASERRIAFSGDHTAAARILCEIDPPFRAPSPGASASAVVIRKTLINAFGERYKLKARGDMAQFANRVKSELKDGRGLILRGDHTEFVRVFKRRIVVRQMTARFIDAIRRGELPEWRKPWRESVRPRSGRSGERFYTAITNILALIRIADEKGHEDPRWITREYAEKIGRPVRGGEMGAIIDPAMVTVYNWEQCEGADYGLAKMPTSPGAQAIMDGYIRREESDPEMAFEFSHSPQDLRDLDRAVYYPTGDLIIMPHRRRFRDDARQYYATAFHEIAHSTGHRDRLGRLQPARFGSHPYGKEELIAEMTAFLLAVEAGLTSDDPLTTFNDPLTQDAAAYLKSWLTAIEENPNLLYEASKGANEAYKYALDADGFREKTRERARKRNEGW